MTRIPISWHHLRPGDEVLTTCDGEICAGVYDGVADYDGDTCAVIQFGEDSYRYYPLWMPARIQLMSRLDVPPEPEPEASFLRAFWLPVLFITLTWAAVIGYVVWRVLR